ncbi:NAD-binding protein [Phellopilus nigrolimitatus]|nr:NAD-binding protein [Phellopilus nigrolimitatus]
MKIAVTGCNGRVGRRVVLYALKEGHEVVGIDCSDTSGHEDVVQALAQKDFAYIKADLRDYDRTLEVLSGCQGIAHLAAYPNPGDYVWQTHNSNVVISWNVLRAAAELGITRIAQASTCNVVALMYSAGPKIKYFPIDEDHPCEPDEPYGLSKLVAEQQAATIVRRYPDMRIASLRLHWSLPSRLDGVRTDSAKRRDDLWGYVQQDSAAEAFLLALTNAAGKWKGHDAFFIVAPDTADLCETPELHRLFWTDVPLKEGKTLEGRAAFFDCSKAERVLGWVHKTEKE